MCGINFLVTENNSQRCHMIERERLLCISPLIVCSLSALSSQNTRSYWVSRLSRGWLEAELPPADAVHAAVQPPGKAAVTEMVCASVWQGEEEDLQRSGPDHTGQEAQDVQLPGVERPQDCVQEVREV